MYDFLFVNRLKSKKGKFYVFGHISEKDAYDFSVETAWIELTESQYDTILDDWEVGSIYEVRGSLGKGMRPVFSL